MFSLYHTIEKALFLGCQKKRHFILRSFEFFRFKLDTQRPLLSSLEQTRCEILFWLRQTNLLWACFSAQNDVRGNPRKESKFVSSFAEENIFNIFYIVYICLSSAVVLNQGAMKKFYGYHQSIAEHPVFQRIIKKTVS